MQSSFPSSHAGSSASSAPITSGPQPNLRYSRHRLIICKWFDSILCKWFRNSEPEARGGPRARHPDGGAAVCGDRRRRSRPRWKSTSRRPARNIWGAFARVAHAGLSSWGAGSPVCSFGSRASSALRSQNGHRSLALKKRQFLAFLQSPAGCSARGRDGVTSHRARTMRPPSVVLRTANSASSSRYCLCTACLEEELEVKMELIRRRRAR
jgi:hypothetical protein